MRSMWTSQLVSPSRSLAQPLPRSPFPLSFLCRCPRLCHEIHHILHHVLRQRSQRAASGSRIRPFIPVMGVNNLSSNRNLNAQLATMVEPAGRPWLSHGVFLGSFWCRERKFFVLPTCPTHKATPFPTRFAKFPSLARLSLL